MTADGAMIATTRHALRPGILTLLGALTSHVGTRLAFDHDQTLRDTNWSGHHFGVLRFFLAERAWAAHEHAEIRPLLL